MHNGYLSEAEVKRCDTLSARLEVLAKAQADIEALPAIDDDECEDVLAKLENAIADTNVKLKETERGDWAIIKEQHRRMDMADYRYDQMRDERAVA